MDVIDALSELGARVEPVLERYILSNAAEGFKEPLLYPVSTGGKRIRPALTMASTLALEGDLEKSLPAAAAVELAHNYSLIFDDIIDHGEVRRGMPTVWRRYGITTAILVAVHYRESIAQALNDTVDPPRFHAKMAETLKLLVDGERLDVLFEQAGRLDEPYVLENRWRRVTLGDYIDMVYRKTGALIETSCLFGAYTAGAGSAGEEAMARYGRGIGIAFQVADDIIDIFGRPEATGKKPGKDIEEHKLGNIVIALALEELDPGRGERLLEILSTETVTEREVGEAVKLISSTRAAERARALGLRYVDEALEALQGLPENEGRRMLEGLARFIIEREF